MYPFNAKQFAVAVLVVLITGCASTVKNDGVDANAGGPSSDSQGKNSDTVNANSNSSVDSTVSVVDPMADIQINAEIKSTYKQVAQLDKLKKYVQAIKLLDGVQLKYPQLSGPDYQKARIYFSQKKFDLAIKSVDLSLANNSRNYYSLNLKGVILREQGKFDEAREMYFLAIEAYPAYPASHLNLGVLADIYLRDLPLALLQYREYMKLTSNQDKKVANWVLELERRINAGD